MRVPTWITCVWPGLPRLWVRGDAAGLIWAVGFALLLNVAIITTFVYSELVSPPVRTALWWGLAGFWLASVAWAVHQLRLTANRPEHNRVSTPCSCKRRRSAFEETGTQPRGPFAGYSA